MKKVVFIFALALSASLLFTSCAEESVAARRIDADDAVSSGEGREKCVTVTTCIPGAGCVVETVCR